MYIELDGEKKLIDTGPRHITQRITYRPRPPLYHTKNNATVVGEKEKAKTKM